MKKYSKNVRTISNSKKALKTIFLNKQIISKKNNKKKHFFDQKLLARTNLALITGKSLAIIQEITDISELYNY